MQYFGYELHAVCYVHAMHSVHYVMYAVYSTQCVYTEYTARALVPTLWKYATNVVA